MTLGLSLYDAATRILEPAAPLILRSRLKAGKERADRMSERLGRTSHARPAGPLVWMHGASVGECRLLLDMFARLKAQAPHVSGLITSQTLTAADMIAAAGLADLKHQMAPIDAPGPVNRFLDHWRPDAAVFAEGEIWPNLLLGLKARRIPAILANARLTERSLQSWQRRRDAARKIFSAFDFIGAADTATQTGLSRILDREITAVGNLKLLGKVEPADPVVASNWLAALGRRPVCVAASTHPGEDIIALEAFATVRQNVPAALLIIAPRHPARGGSIRDLALTRGFAAQLRSQDRDAPLPMVEVLVADTLGELPLWYAIGPAVFLGGASVSDVGGHNPVEPLTLGRPVMSGPHGFNFREIFDALQQRGLVTIGESSADLARYWRDALEAPPTGDLERLNTFLESARQPYDQTLAAILSRLPNSAHA